MVPGFAALAASQAALAAGVKASSAACAMGAPSRHTSNRIAIRMAYSFRGKASGSIQVCVFEAKPAIMAKKRGGNAQIPGNDRGRDAVGHSRPGATRAREDHHRHRY